MCDKSSTLLLILSLFFFFSCGKSDYDRGKEFFELGDYQKAAELFNKSIEVEPSNFEAHFILAQTYLKLNNAAGAFKEYNIAYKLDSTNTDFLMSYAKVLAIVSKYQAYTIFYKLINLTNEDAYIDSVVKYTGLNPYSYKELNFNGKDLPISKSEKKYITYENDHLVFSTTLPGKSIGGQKRLIFINDLNNDSLYQISPQREDIFDSFPFVDFRNNKVYFVDIFNYHICSNNLRGTNYKILATTIIEDYGTDPGQVKATLDGNTLAFIASAHQSNTEVLFTMNPTSYNFKPLFTVSNQTISYSENIGFAFSPDSKSIAIFVNPWTNSNGYYLSSIDLKSNKFEQLLHQPVEKISNVNFSSNGNFILFIGQEIGANVSALFIKNLKDNRLIQIPYVEIYTLHSNGSDILYCINDSLFISNLFNGTTHKIAVLNNLRSNILAISKDASSIIYSLDNKLVKINLPLTKVDLKEFKSRLSNEIKKLNIFGKK